MLACAASSLHCAHPTQTTTPWQMPTLAGPSVAAPPAARDSEASALSETAPTGDLPDAVEPHQDALWLDDEARARADALRRHRPLLVAFSAEWCVPCGLLEADTLSAPAVRAALAASFVALHVDVTEETRANREQQTRYGVRGLPLLLVLDEHGREFERIEQYVTSESLLATLESVRAKHPSTTIAQ